MGTNFYWKQGFYGEVTDYNDPRKHIGKRSAAGAYCWQCGISLKVNHTKDIHKNGSLLWVECPSCGEGRERAFCSSFTWTMMIHYWRLKSMLHSGDERKAIEDEHGNEYTASEFLFQELRGVAIEFQSYGYWS